MDASRAAFGDPCGDRSDCASSICIFTGAGGLSAPGAPAAERDGNNGLPGVNGSIGDIGVCNNSAGC